MRDAEKTIGNIIDKSAVTIIGSVDENGFPNTKAMLPPRKRSGIREIFLTTNTSSMRVGHYRNNSKAVSIFTTKDFSEALCLSAPWKC